MSQFFHIHPDNPQPRLIRQAADIIEQGGVVVLPTDSGYAIGCALGNKQAKERIERIRGIENTITSLYCAAIFLSFRPMLESITKCSG